MNRQGITFILAVSIGIWLLVFALLFWLLHG